jgi:thiamine biosynthesis lipoprotein
MIAPDPAIHPSAVTPTRPHRSRIVVVEHVMGTVVTIDVRPPLVERSALEPRGRVVPRRGRAVQPVPARQRGHRVAAGELRLDDVSPELRAIVTLADEVRDRTDGCFDARRHRPDGRLDPTGIVKGWSVGRPSSASGSPAPGTRR